MSTKNGGERMRVLQLRARDFKVLREVEIMPTGEIITISGEPGQGKTSILEAIEAALRGGDETLVRRGADHAELFLAVGDLTVSRSIDLDGKQKLAVSKDGMAMKTADAKSLLASLFGEHVFRPIRWVQLSGGDSKGRTERLREQRDQLLHAIPLRLDEAEMASAVAELGALALAVLGEMDLNLDLDRQHGLVACELLRKTCYDARSGVNRLVEDASSRLRGLPVPPAKVPAEDRATLAGRERELEQMYQRALGAEKAQGATRARAEQLREAVAVGTEAVAQLVLVDEDPIVAAGVQVAGQIEELRKQLTVLEGRREQLRQELAGAREKNAETKRRTQQIERDRQELADLSKNLGQAIDDPEVIRKRLDVAKAAHADRRIADDYQAMAEQVRTAQDRAKALDQLVDLFREQLPQRLLGRAKFPVEGLGLDGEQLTVKGVPIHRLGTSEQIRLGVRVAAALNPDVAFCCVDGAESLGASGRRDLAAAAEDFGLQLWISEVSETPAPGSIVMRAGVAQEVGS